MLWLGESAHFDKTLGPSDFAGANSDAPYF
jgi:hypothetical protein